MTRLPYIVQGDADGTPVLLLHGWSDSHRSFEPLLAHLPPSIRAVAMTQRGHGDAERPASYTASEFAADAIGILDRLGIESAVVAGHSMGSMVAQRIAVEYPWRVRHLVLIGSKPTFADPAMDDFYAEVEQLTDPVDPAFIREFQVSTLAQPVAEEFLEMVCEESAKLPLAVWHGVMNDLLRVDLSADLRRIRVPTTIAWGAKDGFCTSADQMALAAAIPGAVPLVFAYGGHAPHWEDPATFAAELIAVASQPAAAPARAA